jgi:hypothetical protein
MVSATRLPVDRDANATEMAEEIFGDGVSVVAATYSGDRNSSGIYSDGDSVSPGVTPSDTGVILSTGRVQDFTNRRGDANQEADTSRDTAGVDRDADFDALAGTATFDAAILDVDFIPDGDTLKLNFVFASEEYPEYINSVFNDAVGIWINGSPAQLTVGNANVNNLSDENLYIDNTSSDFNTEMDGFTVTLSVSAPVVAGVVNTLRIGVADVADSIYDSAILIAGGSAQTALTATDDTLTLGEGKSKDIDVLANDTGPVGATMTVTHINGVAVNAGDTVTLASGEQVTLNADGTLTVTADAGEETVNFTYTVADGLGGSDTAFVTASVVPCFVAGTRIRTPGGEVPVENLSPGDLVNTLDHGPQPVRWVGRRRVSAEGDLAPIRILAGTFGDHAELCVSPQHRILLGDAMSELLFGEPEVLVPAKFLLNDRTVLRQPGGTVDYLHLLFDTHQVIFSEGLPSESFHPGPQTIRDYDEAALEELRRLFPGIDPATGAGYSPSARPSLKAYEAHILLAGRAPAAQRAAA